MLARLRSLLRALFQRERFENTLSEEMRFHVEAYAADLMRAGVPRDEAERRARVEFGPVESLREEARQARGLRFADEVRQDVRYAICQLVRTPSFTAAAIISLALGIGANTAIFSFMDAVVFRTLPISNPHELYFFGHGTAKRASLSANYPLLERYQALDVFSGVTAYDREGFRVLSGDGLEMVDGLYVSGNYHGVLGVPMSLGRGFSNEPDRPSGRGDIAVISDAYWERRFARRPDVVGQTLNVNGRPTTIVGVTAPGFYGLSSGTRIDLTLPISAKALAEPDFLGARDTWGGFTLVGRRKTGVPEAQALAAADAVFQRYWLEPENAWARGDGTERRPGRLAPAGRGSEGLRTQYAKPLGILLAMVGIVLLIACVNVANLLLARAATRVREVAVRISLGASRRRVVRQLLAESFLLAGTGGALGIGVALASMGAVLAAFNVGSNPIQLDVTLSGRVLLFTLAVSIVTAIAFGLVPALKATRVDLTPALKASVSTHRHARSGASVRALAASQLALSVVVIAAAGLLVRSLYNLKTFNAGFARDHVLLFNLDASGLSPERRAQFYAELDQRLRALPGVVATAYSKRSPLDFSSETRRIEVPGFQPREGGGVSANVVTPEYFAIFGINVIRGRGFSPQDREGVPKVGVVNEAAARFYYGSGDPIGQTFFLGADKEPVTIVGIVGDVRHEALREDAPRMVFTPMAQPAVGLDGKPEHLERIQVEVRTDQEPRALTAAVRDAVRPISKDVLLSYVRTMQHQVDASIVRERLLARLASGFGILAFLLAFVGLYGVISYSVTRRVREIGVRVAIGASKAQVTRQIMRETLALSSAGIVIGIAVTLAGTKLVSAFLFGLSPRDPLTLGIVVTLLLATAIVAGYRPARRAAAIEPILALKTE